MQSQMEKYLIEDKLFQTIDQFSEMKITHVKFYSTPLNKINQFFMLEIVECVRHCLVMT